jgi:hypothetical protein
VPLSMILAESLFSKETDPYLSFLNVINYKPVLEMKLTIMKKGNRIIGERNENVKILKKETMMM